MFASTYPSPAHRLPGRHGAGSSLYHQVGVETRMTGATPHQLVTMLFDGWLEAVAQARGAMRSGDIATKGAAISRAVRILDEGLRAGLDLRGGGSLARDLNDLYGYLTVRLTQANLRSDEQILDECQRLLKPIHEAWLSIAVQPAAAVGFSHLQRAA
ncbi:MAG: flagellar export chaperone FliS [Rubrivivax sp.]